MRRHDYDQASDPFTIESFLSDDNAIVALFKNEVAQSLAAIARSGGSHTPEGFHCYIRDQFSTFGMAARFDAALAVLMASPDFILY